MTYDHTFYGAIDLGTNTCRLLIASARFQDKKFFFDPVDSLSRTVRFGESIEESKMLSQQAIERGVSVLEECMRHLENYNVKEFRCVATAACRYAQNSSLLVDKAKDKTGIIVEIIQPEEESRLAVGGCAELFDLSTPYVLIFDIGGGSMELVFCRVKDELDFEVIDSVSFPYGFSTYKQALKEPESRQAITQFLGTETNEFAIRNNLYTLMNENKVQMIGASGTITTLAAIVLGLEKYDREKVHNILLSKQDILNAMQYISSLSYSERAQHPCIGHQRADSIIGALALFQSIYDIFHMDHVLAADRGVREGILFDFARKAEQEKIDQKVGG